MQICRYKQILEWRKQKKKEPLQDKTEIHIIRKIEHVVHEEFCNFLIKKNSDAILERLSE